MKCFRCGARVPEASRYCGACGTQITDSHLATVVLPPDESDELLQRVRRVFAGEYEILEEIGRGGMAVVYRASEIALHRPVALKVLPPEVGITVKAAERFKREARLVASLDHPNIIPVYRAGQVGGILHIAMKLVEGRTLDALVKQQGPLPVPVVLAILRASTRALAYAHGRDVIHRDVKGANILVDRDARILVSDFGVALRGSDVTLTAAGSIIGTPAFMSPEQCAGKRAAPQSDQYGLGIVAFQMLAGAVPFHSDTLAGFMQHHFFTPVPDLRAVRDDVPGALVEVVERTLAKQPEDRFGTTDEMVAAVEALPFSDGDRRESERTLRALVRGEPVPAVAARALPALPDQPTVLLDRRARQRRRRTRRRLIGLGVGAAAIAAAALWQPGAGGEPEAPTARDLAAAASLGGGQAPAPGTLAPRAPAAASAATPSAPAPRALLRVLTTPPNAQILVDGRPVGELGSAFDVEIAAGMRRIQVRAQGYRPLDTSVIVPPGRMLNLGRVVLAPGDGAP